MGKTSINIGMIFNKLCSLINDCINIEKNIEHINEINKKILEGKKYINLKIKFSPEEIQKHSILEQIKSFGIIFNDSYKYIFKKGPDNIKEKRTFIITGENGNIMTRVTPFNNWDWRGTTCLYELKRGKIYKWKISILKTKHKYIAVGIAPNDFVINQLVGIVVTILNVVYHLFVLVHLIIIMIIKALIYLQ